MANTFGLLLLAICIAFICAQLMKDAKAFGKFMLVLLLGLVVGAGVKALTKKLDKVTPEKTVVAPTITTPTQNGITPFVLENTVACPDSVSKDIVVRDRVEAETEGLPTALINVAYLDDS